VNVKGESDIERVRTVALLALSENTRLTSELVRLKRENLALKGATPEQLQQELRLLDEKLAQDAAAFLKQVDDESKERSEPAEKKAKAPRERSGPRPEQKSLRVVDVSHDVDEADRACGECGGALAYCVGGPG
jgi:transposase